MHKSLSLIIPVFNEERIIEQTLVQLLGFLEKNHMEPEIIVVDDGSTDRTKLVLERFSSRIKIIPVVPNHGKGFAIKTGMLAATGEYILFMDADLATPVTEITKILEEMQEVDADIAIGSRRIDLAKVKRTHLRSFASKVFNAISHFLIPLDYMDTQCGFKAFKKEAAKEIFQRAKIERWAFDLEVLFIAEIMNYKVIECAIEWQERSGSKIRMFRDAFLMIKDLFLVRLYNLVDAYKLRDTLVEERNYDVLQKQGTEIKEL